MSVEGRICCSALLLVPSEDVVAQSSVVPLSDVSADLKQTHEMDINATSPPSIDDFGMPTLTPFHGWVKYSNGLGQDVKVNNLNTSECGQTQGYHFLLLSVFDLLNLNASDNIGNFTEFNHTVTQEEMNNGGFVQNITITIGKCGDVNNDGLITGGDATMIWDVACGVQPESILENPWAADVNCDGLITGGDATMIWDVACGVQPESILKCCS